MPAKIGSPPKLHQKLFKCYLSHPEPWEHAPAHAETRNADMDNLPLLKVLLIEDDEDDYVLVRDLLSEPPSIKFHLEWVKSSSAALSRMEEDRYDACLLDYRLGEENGLDILERANERGYSVPIIFLTGWGNYELDLKAMKAGAADYLIKGQITPPLLERTIRYSIERKRTEEELKKYGERLEELVRNRTAQLTEMNEKLQREIIERERIEGELRKEKETNDLLLNAIPHVALLITKERKILALNKVTRELGAKPDDYCWQAIHKMATIGSEALEHYERSGKPLPGTRCSFCLADEAMKAQKPMSREVDALGRTWDTWWVPIDSEAYLHYAIDITDRKEAEEELKHHRERLREMVAERTDELVRTNQRLQREITERKIAEEALRHSEETMRLIIESSPIGIRICQHGRYVYVNPAFARMFGYENAEELIGLSMERLYAPHDRPLVLQRRQDRLAGKPVSQSYEARGQKKDGIHFDIVVWVTRIGYRGEPAILGFVIDVSSEKALQAQLIQAQKLQAIGTLAGGITHDFNNILGAILGFAELALLHSGEDSRLRSYMTNLHMAGLRARDLVMQILTFCRHNEQERKPVQPSHLLKETLKLLRASLPSTIEIRQTIDTESLVLADPTQIHQIVMNLCMNAAHAMREHGGLLGISLTDVQLDAEVVDRFHELSGGSYVRLVVSDTGNGMDRAVLERIFDPYFTTKATGEGTGLGLSVVHGIVKSYGGCITVHSEPGIGSTFEVLLPRLEDQPEGEHEISLPLARGEGTILFVDDEEPLTRAGKEMLEFLGYDVVAHKCSIEAVNAFRMNPGQFSLVITDQTMPQMTGVELAKEIIAIRPDIPIILSTGFPQLAALEQAKEIGVQKLASKPLMIQDLAVLVREVLEGK
jgi:PAS domain S-box-containing protein